MASMAAGIAINRTGTGFPHPMGYSITLSDGIPHGRACGAFEGAYIEYNMRTETGARKLTALAGALGTTPAEMARRIPLKADVKLVLTDDQMEE
jgi:alcohol dehydrogenase class IV